MTTFADIDPTLGGSTTPGTPPSKSTLETELGKVKTAGLAVEADVADHETRVAALEGGGGGGGIADIGLAGQWVTPTVSGSVATLTADHIALDADADEVAQTFVLLINEGDPSAAFTVTVPNTGTPGKTNYIMAVDPSQTGIVTLQVADYGSDNDRKVDLAASVILPFGGSLIGVFCDTNVGGTKGTYRTNLLPPEFTRAVKVASAVREKYISANVSGAVELDMEAAPVQALTLTGEVTTMTIANRPPDGYVGTVTVFDIQDGSGGHDLAWPSGTLWSGGAAPTRVTTAGAVNVWSLTVFGQSGPIYGFPGALGAA